MAALRDAEIVIVGGGAIGTGVAYALARAGHTDVLLIEKEPGLSQVTSAQAAGLVGQARSDVDRTRLAMWSVKTFSELQSDAAPTPSWRQTGSLRVATTPERVAEFRRFLRVAAEAGLDLEEIAPAEAERMWPGMRLGTATSILWCPQDGYLQPADLVTSYHHHARALGVGFATDTTVEDILVRNGRVAGVRTDRGEVRCEHVVNAAGAHAYHVARLVGIELPIIPVRHEFFTTVEVDSIRPEFPVMRAVDQTLYLRADVHSLLVGGWEPRGLSIDPRTYRLDERPPVIEPDWPVLANFADQLEPLYPRVVETGIRATFRGWPTFAPDGRFIVGESGRVKGFVMAGACNAHGVSGSAGIGRHVVEAMFDPDPSPYVRSLSPDRFTETSWDWASAEVRARRVYETYYSLTGH
ncbi:MAG TPA: FAD-dependent oxidoreductase [Candidatus Dormibacteraeota bacterium]